MDSSYCIAFSGNSEGDDAALRTYVETDSENGDEKTRASKAVDGSSETNWQSITGQEQVKFTVMFGKLETIS